MNNQPKFKKGDSPVSDMLAIPDDHVWPVTPDNEVVIVESDSDKGYKKFLNNPEKYIEKTRSSKIIDQELEDAAIKSVGEIEDMAGMVGYNGFKKGADWKAEQSANDAIEFADWCEDNYWPTAQTGKWRAEFSSEDELLTTKQLYELWQQNKKK